MIIKVENRKQLKTFVHFIETLYHQDLHMVYPIFHVLTNELKREVLHKKEYTAILSYKNNVCVGRLLYTIADSKKQNKKIGYFSYFDCIDDIASAKELFNYAYQDLKTKGIDYIEGPFTPYDPDNRRGLLIKGFDSDPIIFTTYNYPYYERLLEAVGMNKAIDTVLLSAPVNKESKRKLNTFSKFFKRSHDVVISALDYKNIEREIKDIHQIFEQSTSDAIYQDTPSIALIESVVKQMKFFINPKFVRIAREAKTNNPIGFCFVLPDFNQVFKKTKGRLRMLQILREKKKIVKARGMLQYVVPQYQGTGLITCIFESLFLEFEQAGITHFEAGTMMEDNPKPINIFKKFGGEIIKVYRIYGKHF